MNQAFAPSSSSGIIIPLYIYPTPGAWDRLINATNNTTNPSVPVVAIINIGVPGGPGTECPNTDYQREVKRLLNANITVIGYVDTSRGIVPEAVAKLQIDKWYDCYTFTNSTSTKINGIFFDQMAVISGFETYYQNLTDYAKSKPGFTFTVGNPGQDIPRSYIGKVDNIIIYENAGVPSLGYLDDFIGYPKTNFSFIAHSVQTYPGSQYVHDAAIYVGYMYITESYFDFPPYLEQLFTDLQTT